MPPYRLSSASLAQWLRPLPGAEKAAMSSNEATVLSGPAFIVAVFVPACAFCGDEAREMAHPGKG
ncbi:MAG: hypothetical protein ACYDH4_05735 [Candidatus Cryosericum sp.]